jgi:hypothetical protein
MKSSLEVIYAKYQSNVSFLEHVKGVRSENADVVDRNVFSRLPMMTENALKLANILTENQAHGLIFFILLYLGFKLSFEKIF